MHDKKLCKYVGEIDPFCQEYTPLALYQMSHFSFCAWKERICVKKLKNIAKKSWRREEEENTRNIKDIYVKRDTNNFYVSALQPF